MKEYTAASLFVREWGSRDAPAVLYWDGLGGTGLHANEIAPVLSVRYGLRVIAPDAPGHGRSPSLPPDGYLPSRLAALAAALLSELGVERAAFVGLSWGGQVGCSFAARFPEKTVALVLIDGGYFRPQKLGRSKGASSRRGRRSKRTRSRAGTRTSTTSERRCDAGRPRSRRRIERRCARRTAG